MAKDKTTTIAPQGKNAQTKPAKNTVKAPRGQTRFMRMLSRIKRYFKDMFSELKKATWPTKAEVAKYTGIVLAFVIILATVVGLMDYGLAQLLKLITAS